MKVPITFEDNLKVMRWKLIKQTGWTAEYVDSLPLGRLYEFHQIEDGLSKAA